MARKGWENLSPGYRSRLERSGISSESYAKGASLHKARGYVSREHESERSRERREINTWVKEYAHFYGKDEEEIRDALKDVSFSERLEAIRLQSEMQALYDKGYAEEARQRWETRNPELPEWMFYYHGFFS